jgi:hypothetical protein
MCSGDGGELLLPPLPGVELLKPPERVAGGLNEIEGLCGSQRSRREGGGVESRDKVEPL